MPKFDRPSISRLREELNYNRQSVPHPKNVTIYYWYTDAADDRHYIDLFKGYPAATLLRFSGTARRQLLEDGRIDLHLFSRHRGWVKDMVDNLDCLFTWLTEMSHLPTSPSSALPPIMAAHFSNGLQQAMLCLELVESLELDKFWRQDTWIRQWIMHWITNRDVLPHEVLCAWQLFKDDPIDKAILDAIIKKAAASWTNGSLYFVKGQEEWITETRLCDFQLWDNVAAECDGLYGEGHSSGMWAASASSASIRDVDWELQARYAPWAKGPKEFREKLRRSAAVHNDILREVYGWELPRLSAAAQKKRLLKDGHWIAEEQENKRGEKIRRWSYVD